MFIILAIVDSSRESKQLVNLNHVLRFEPVVEYQGNLASVFNAPESAKSIVHWREGEDTYSTETVQEIEEKVKRCVE